MKEHKVRQQFSFLSIKGLIFIYILLCILTILFTYSFFKEILYDDEGIIPSGLSLLGYLTVPAVLLLFLLIAILSLFKDIFDRRPGIKLKARLLLYFIIIIVFTVVPIAVISSISVNEAIGYWENINTKNAGEASIAFAHENYEFHSKNFESIIDSINDNINDWSALLSAPLPQGIASVQDFRLLEDGKWSVENYGGEYGRLASPPSQADGHLLAREFPRDTGFLRYTLHLPDGIIRLINYNLGTEYNNEWIPFEIGLSSIEKQNKHFEVINLIKENKSYLMVFYYGFFFLPIIIMTIIISISFTKRVTNPIVELTDATRRVTEGDLSIQILARRGDELGLLIRSFNAMVQNLEKSRAALLKAEKISIWQNMAQQLAHEIKNPLTPIKLSAERVLRRWHKNPKMIGDIIEDSMLAIIQETEGLSTLLNEFRTLSKPMEPSKSWTTLDKTIEELINPYRGSYPEIEFDTEHVSTDILVKIDKHRFSQAVTNLIINSIDAMDGKGIIEIRTDLVKKREMWYCRLNIKDNGKGISKQDSTSIFTPYFTTKESGTGLGLPIVERIINDHGGAIWFNSGEGIGTTFFIDLPISEEK